MTAASWPRIESDGRHISRLVGKEEISTSIYRSGKRSLAISVVLLVARIGWGIAADSAGAVGSDPQKPTAVADPSWYEIAVSFTPPVLDFGDVEVGSYRDMTIRAECRVIILAPPGGNALTISWQTTPYPPFSASGTDILIIPPLPPGYVYLLTLTIPVRFAPPAAQDYTGRLDLFAYTDPFMPPIWPIASAPLRGRGVLPRVATPTILPTSGVVLSPTTVTVACATPAALIYHTLDGSEPTTQSATGTSFPISGAPGSSLTVKAKAFKSGMAPSDTAARNYTFQPRYALSLSVNPPGSGDIMANPPPDVHGTYAAGTLVTLTAEPAIGKWSRFERWSGDPPAQIVIPEWIWENPLHGYLMDRNKTLTANFVIEPPKVPTPDIQPDSGPCPSHTTVTMSCVWSGVKIYYTTNTLEPAESSKQYTAPFQISGPTGESMTLKAKAYLANLTPSDTATKVYTFCSKGDVDSNGRTNLFDILRLIDIALGRPPAPTPCERWCSDVYPPPDGDGVINLFDCLEEIAMILRGEGQEAGLLGP